MTIQVKRLYEVLNEHADTVEQDGAWYVVFKESGNTYRRFSQVGVQGVRVYEPIINGIQRSDLRIEASLADADAALLKREGII